MIRYYEQRSSGWDIFLALKLTTSQEEEKYPDSYLARTIEPG
jgi:hypothetical protein